MNIKMPNEIISDKIQRFITEEDWAATCNQLIELGFTEAHIRETPYLAMGPALMNAVIKRPEFFITDRLKGVEIAESFGKSGQEFDAFKKKLLSSNFPPSNRSKLAKELFDKYKVNEDLRKEFEEKLANAEPVSLPSSMPYIMQYGLEIFISYAKPLISIDGIMLKHIAQVTKQYDLSPQELNAYVNGSLANLPFSTKEFIAMIKELADAELVKIEFLEKSAICPFIKNVDEFKAALKFIDVGFLSKYEECFKFFAGASAGPKVVENYGVLRILDVFSRYDFNDKQLRDFAFKLPRENGEFASHPDDLDRLAKIILAPNLSESDKKRFMDDRHTYKDMESLEKALALAELEQAEGLLSWVYNSVFGSPQKELVSDATTNTEDLTS